MTRCFTWTEPPTLEEPVLLIINSDPADTAQLDSVLAQLATVSSPETLYVIAPTALRDRLVRSGISAPRILLTTVDKQELEISYFLESPQALQWLARLEPKTVIGSAAHNLYNEEIKDIFELRVTTFLSGVLLAHTLPNPYVYVFDTEALLERAGRPSKVAAYVTSVQQLLDDFYGQWNARGRPSTDDSPDYGDVAATLARHLGPDVLTFDEAAPIPLAHADTTSERTLVFRFTRNRLLRALRHASPSKV